MKQLSRTKLTFAYVIALSIIAIISVDSYNRVNDALILQRKSGMIINLSGRQRMWSQRIASLAQQYVAGDQTAKTDLLIAVDEFETAHRRLILGDPVLDIPPMNARKPDQVDALRRVYFDGDHPLDFEMGNYIRHARHLVTVKPHSLESNADIAAILASSRNALRKDLDSAVTVYTTISNAQIDHLLRLQLVSLAVITCALLSEVCFIFWPMICYITRSHEELRRLAMLDPLTGVFNRRSFFEKCTTELARARRYHQKTSLMMVDLDRFKSINDSYGHSGGDDVLKAFTKYIAKTLRPSDTIGRLGGEEFAICLADTDVQNASIVADRIRREVSELIVESADYTIKFTISVGVVEFALDDTELTRAMGLADRALYDAKRYGRNRVHTCLVSQDRYGGAETMSIGFDTQMEAKRLSQLVGQT